MKKRSINFSILPEYSYIVVISQLKTKLSENTEIVKLKGILINNERSIKINYAKTQNKKIYLEIMMKIFGAIAQITSETQFVLQRYVCVDYLRLG